MLASWFAVTRSSFPSPFRSAMAVNFGRPPVPKNAGPPKVPFPLPRRTMTVFGSVPSTAFVMMRSFLPSPFTSAMAAAWDADCES